MGRRLVSLPSVSRRLPRNPRPPSSRAASRARSQESRRLARPRRRGREPSAGGAETACGDESPVTREARLLALEQEHKDRRGYVWADLGWSPLALALEHLAEVARITDTTPPEGTVEAIVEWYGTSGWRADRAMLEALGQVERKLDIEVVEAALTAVYRPWAHETAAALQQAVGPTADGSTYAALAAAIGKGRGRPVRGWPSPGLGERTRRAFEGNRARSFRRLRARGSTDRNPDCEARYVPRPSERARPGCSARCAEAT